MKKLQSFQGFPKESIQFYREIERHNTRTWFHAHHEEFQKFVMEPARAFVTEMGIRLMTISPYIYAEPKVNRSIYRIARDARRNKNEPPYKTELAIVFWETALPRSEAPSFYFSLSGRTIGFGAGIYRFSNETLQNFREALVHKKLGMEFRQITQDLKKYGYELHGTHYKRVPVGYDRNHQNAEYLKYNGVYAYTEVSFPKETHSEALVPYVFAHYLQMAPLYKWLQKRVA